jgi:hypothetical protein
MDTKKKSSRDWGFPPCNYNKNTKRKIQHTEQKKHTLASSPMEAAFL